MLRICWAALRVPLLDRLGRCLARLCWAGQCCGVGSRGSWAAGEVGTRWQQQEQEGKGDGWVEGTWAARLASGKGKWDHALWLWHVVGQWVACGIPRSISHRIRAGHCSVLSVCWKYEKADIHGVCWVSAGTAQPVDFTFGRLCFTPMTEKENWAHKEHRSWMLVAGFVLPYSTRARIRSVNPSIQRHSKVDLVCFWTSFHFSLRPQPFKRPFYFISFHLQMQLATPFAVSSCILLNFCRMLFFVKGPEL